MNQMLLAIELIQIPFMEGIAESIEIILHDQFAKFGSLIVFFYAMLPTIFKVIGTGGIFIRLLDNGISPLFMYVTSLIGKMIGFYLLYLAGRFFWQLLNKNKKKKQELLPENHWIHKYRHVLYLAVPWFGSVGEVFIIISGHQRIGFLRILPFLAVSEGVRYGINLMLLLGQLELPNLL